MRSGAPTMAAGFRSLTEEELRAHLGWLRQLASFLIRDEARADDAVQETLSAAWRSPPSMDRDVKPWLARVLQARGKDRRGETATAHPGGERKRRGILHLVDGGRLAVR